MAATRRNIWRSNRLIYKPAEATDEAFLLSLNDHGSESFQNATMLLPVPPGPRGSVEYREFLQTCLLGCIIYLPAPEEVPESADSNSSTDNSNTSPTQKQQETPQPTPIGTISLQPIDPKRSHHRNTSIGITILHPYQNKGYGSEAILWATEWAFRHAGLHRVGIGAFSWNEGAWKLYQRLGFVMEGRSRESVWANGRWEDEVSLGMLAGEWWERYGGRGKVVD